MKVITATAATQGERRNDYNWCVEGELVVLPVVICSDDERDPDGACGCGRGWAGTNSHRATTTALVRDLPMTTAEYSEAVRSSLEAGGWWPQFVDDEGVQEMVSTLLDIAANYPVGSVLEKRLDIVASRSALK